MVKKYVKALEEHEINSKTGEIWVISDVPNLWKTKVTTQVLADGYVFDEDGHAVRPIIEEEPTEEVAESEE